MNNAKKLLEIVESASTYNSIDEVSPKRRVVFRNGDRKSIMDCPAGYEYDSTTNTCRRMTIQQIRKRRIAAIRGWRSKRAELSQINRKRAATMRRRHSQGM